MKHSLPILRVARPTDRLDEISKMYQEGLGLGLLGSFEDPDGFSGVILGAPNSPYHIEFTSKAGHAAGKAPTPDNLLVYYIPDRSKWESVCESMSGAGFELVRSFNPYWDVNGKTFEDIDGYRVVLQNAPWDL